MNREYIGLKDRDGRQIMTGDIVEFYFAEHGGATPDGSWTGSTKMIDVVARQGDLFYFISEMGGAFAERYNTVCKVVGRMPVDAGLVVDALAFAPTDPARRSALIENWRAQPQTGAAIVTAGFKRRQRWR